MEASERKLRLQVPAIREYLATIRLFGAAAVTHFGGDTDASEDLRLALSESGGLVMRGAAAGDRVQVTLAAAEDGTNVRTEVRRDASSNPPQADRTDREEAGASGDDGEDAADLALALLRALVTELSVEDEEGGGGPVRLSFSLALGAGVEDRPTPGSSTIARLPADG
jgi:anti-sigma regulatory factor (Ser/Thr protein kinase)